VRALLEHAVIYRGDTSVAELANLGKARPAIMFDEAEHERALAGLSPP
jgi:hypothetical protein